MFPPPPAVPADTRVVPDWTRVHQELRRPGVTLMLLWEEYRAAHPEGFGYSWFCKRYEGWSDLLELLDDRHGQCATLITSQLLLKHWHDLIGDPTLGDAILDRLVQNAYRITLKGESMRKRLARTLMPSAPAE